MDKLKKIVLTENFDLREVLDQLLESRGVIDGIDDIAFVITNYINEVLFNDVLKEKFFEKYDKENDVDKYIFSVPVELFKGTDTLFMYNPIFKIYLSVMRNIFGDTERELDDTFYEGDLYPSIINIDGQYYLNKPVFHLAFVVPNNKKIDMLEVADIASHEICHAKKNFYEFIRISNKRREMFNVAQRSLELLQYNEKDSDKKLIGRILYLCSKDEINARTNQLYYQLKQYKRIDIDRDNINQLVRKTKIYETFVEEFDEKITLLLEKEKKSNYLEKEYFLEVLNWVYRNKVVKENPFEYLINLLIVRKNYFIRQIDKVKERVLYENLTMPLKMINPPK